MLILSVGTYATLPQREQRNFMYHRKFSTRLPGGRVENCRSPKRFYLFVVVLCIDPPGTMPERYSNCEFHRIRFFADCNRVFACNRIFAGKIFPISAFSRTDTPAKQLWHLLRETKISLFSHGRHAELSGRSTGARK